MKSPNLSIISNANRKRVMDNYLAYKLYIQQAEDLLKANKYDSLLSIVQNEMPGIAYNQFYKAFKKYSDYKISSCSNGSQNKARISLASRAKLNLEDRDTVISMYVDQRKSLREIAKIYNTTAVTIMSFLKKHGVERRTKNEYQREHFSNPMAREDMKRRGVQSYLNRRAYSTGPELHFKDWLVKNNIKFEEQYRKVGNRHPYDFFLPDFNLLVEIDGYYWHSKPAQVIKDKKHVDDAIAKGYNITRICAKELKHNNMEYDKWIFPN